MGGERTNQAILHNFSTTSSLLEHGVGESFGRATEVGLVSDFGCLADGRPEPRHLFCLCLLPISLSLPQRQQKALPPPSTPRWRAQRSSRSVVAPKALSLAYPLSLACLVHHRARLPTHVKDDRIAGRPCNVRTKERFEVLSKDRSCGTKHIVLVIPH